MHAGLQQEFTPPLETYDFEVITPSSETIQMWELVLPFGSKQSGDLTNTTLPLDMPKKRSPLQGDLAH